jgi:hypothetical protein
VTIKPASPESYAAAQAEFREMQEAREPWMGNASAALLPHHTGLLTHRGVEYYLPPVSYPLGLTIHALDRHYHRIMRDITTLEKAGKTAPQSPAATLLWVEAAQTYKDLAPLLHQGIRPKGLWQRLTWRWRGNPFQDANEQEIEELALLFRAARTISRVRLRASIRAPRYLQWTWPRTGWPSLLNIPPRQYRTLISRVAGSLAASNTTSRG